MKHRIWIIFILNVWFSHALFSQQITVGAERPDHYLDLIEDKRVGMVVNHTSMAFNDHIVDYLLTKNIDVVRIFSPEHGFRGTADAGKHIDNAVDEETGIAIVSLYGANKKPTPEQMQGIDIMIFDIQDVGARFYTYISTMHYVMEACSEQGIGFIVLDRPNPNGHYVDGPVLREKYRSFVGMHKIPIVHGLTVGELAKMINGEYWLPDSLQCELFVIPVENYHHEYQYSLPVKPSPNLPNDISIKLYPSLCLFEGTMMSLGRGTEFPFQVVGYPDSSFGRFSFTPTSMPGASNPKYEGQVCYGRDFRDIRRPPRFTINYVIEFYNKSGRSEDFFNDYFDKLAGNGELKQQIKAGLSPEEIRISWVEELEDYREKRKKYLLYPDFQ